jgi:hypothetical protein
LNSCGNLESIKSAWFHLSGEPLDRDRAKALGDALRMIEDEKGQLALKFQIAKFVLTGTPYDAGATPYQDFSALLYVRNSLIHPKPFVTEFSGPKTDPDRKVRERMRSFDILAEIPRPLPLSVLIQTRWSRDERTVNNAPISTNV